MSEGSIQIGHQKVNTGNQGSTQLQPGLCNVISLPLMSSILPIFTSTCYRRPKLSIQDFTSKFKSSKMGTYRCVTQGFMIVISKRETSILPIFTYIKRGTRCTSPILI